jgi:DNA-binding transcriptional LysR family regulator
VSVDLHLSDQRVAVIEEGFDLAIRFGKLEDSSLMARRLLNMRVVVFASPDYLEKFGEPADPHALASHNCLLQKTSSDPEHWRFRINGKLVSIRVSGQFSANSPRAIAQMAASGNGIGMCPLYIVEPYLERGELKLLLEEMEGTVFGLHAVYPQSRQLTARIRALIDHLAHTNAGY